MVMYFSVAMKLAIIFSGLFLWVGMFTQEFGSTGRSENHHQHERIIIWILRTEVACYMHLQV